MNADQHKLARLNRLEKLRAIARQTAAAEAAQAENTLTQLRGLAERTSAMAQDYSARRNATSGAALQHVGRFVSGLQVLSRTTHGDALRARSIADARQHALVEAERRRAAVEDRATAQANLIRAKNQPPVLSGKRKIGTGLE
ncbi:hypothetical protein [Novosphingobium sp. Leaf2]|uniref:hypothetical protein n=1 Tax=Novosphingobium sp. Leaf2 TaxID=1735670 RepID=UPI0006FA3099|nr:hypothetical protein [Novosphingobium sp. Leaf2]KQM14828.1 hypothetical protein ASE49_11770 [Novosphingobium sp. Leaf2]